MSLRVLIADDHAAVRHALIRSFQQEVDIEIVGEAEDGSSAVDLTGELAPDVVIMDITMPRLDGIGATRRITEEHPAVKIVGLSVHASKPYVSKMFAAGATGYILKDDDFAELVKAVRVVFSGGTYLSSAITDFNGRHS
ncbi:MAG: response regulator transcription factor [Sedimentisphaerales bacterium]|nr:response regulator transcription factor [Sedimentisphaerales bacterium]